jgi:hypothetical protein
VIPGRKRAPGEDFDAASAGAYKAIYYQKTGATNGPERLATGTPSLGKPTLAIGASGQATMQDIQDNPVVQAMLPPWQTPAAQGRGSLADPRYGCLLSKRRLRLSGKTCCWLL